MPGGREIVTSEPTADADSNVHRWLGLALATLAATIAMAAVGLPTPALFAALLIGISYALIAVRRPLDVPSSGITIGQALIGVALGAELDTSTLRAVASNWFGVSAVTLATLALSLGVASPSPVSPRSARPPGCLDSSQAGQAGSSRWRTS